MPQIGKLVPLAEYKKPLLVLSKGDMTKIDKMNQRIIKYQNRIDRYETELNMPWVMDNRKHVLRSKIAKVVEKINDMHNQIRQVKIERHNKQKPNFLV